MSLVKSTLLKVSTGTYAVLLLLLNAMAAAGAQEPSKMLVISGWGTRFGNAKIYISDLGIRIRSNQGGTIWLASRPRRALFVNDENKCFLVVRSRDFKKRYNHMHYDFTGMRTGPVTEKIVSPLKLEKVSLKYPHPAQKMGEFICVKNSALPVSKDVLDFYRDVFWAKNAPQQLTAVGMQEYGRRFHDSGPGEDDARWEWIKTLVPSKVEIVECQRALFRRPAGYRKAKDAADLYFSQGGDLKQSDLQDLFLRNLDIEDKDGDKENK